MLSEMTPILEMTEQGIFPKTVPIQRTLPVWRISLAGIRRLKAAAHSWKSGSEITERLLG